MSAVKGCHMLWLIMSCFTLFYGVQSYPEQGRWTFEMSDKFNSLNVRKSLYKNSSISVIFSCKSNVNLIVTSYLSSSPCANSFLGPHENDLSNFDEAGPDKRIESVNCVAVTPTLADRQVFNDSIYLYFMTISTENNTVFTVDVEVRIKSKSGYLSAIDWPLLPFYSTMCVIYAVYSLVWLVFCFCYWRDMLRVQLWIGAVIFLGLLEKAVFISEYEAVNETGNSVEGAIIAAELVSCLKRSLARMLVIIVSLGFGIIKPTLGPTLHRITALGFLYFVLSSAEAIVRAVNHKTEASMAIMLTIVPLALIDAIICWWIFMSLVQTIRTLLLRKNLIKLTLYRHFRNTLIFAVIASVIFSIWSTRAHKMSACLEDWKELWVDEAFWHWTFSILLLVIMILWRPSANNQRYSYSPLHDVDTEDVEEEVDQGAHQALGDVKKIRNLKSQSSGVYREKEAVLDEDLKWVDENIPTSVLDITLPGILDDDDDIVKRHREEISKMQ